MRLKTSNKILKKRSSCRSFFLVGWWPLGSLWRIFCIDSLPYASILLKIAHDASVDCGLAAHFTWGTCNSWYWYCSEQWSIRWYRAIKRQTSQGYSFQISMLQRIEQRLRTFCKNVYNIFSWVPMQQIRCWCFFECTKSIRDLIHMR